MNKMSKIMFQKSTFVELGKAWKYPSEIKVLGVVDRPEYIF